MTDHKTIRWSEDGTLEVLTFELGAETFAIEAVLIQEILDPLAETRVPGADPLVPAVINFRGRVIPLADLRVAFGMPLPDPDSEWHYDARIIVLELDLGDELAQIGIRTDRVYEVASLHRSAAEPVPALGLKWPRGLLRAIVRRGDDVVLLPDIGAIFRPVLDGQATSTISDMSETRTPGALDA